MTIELGLARGIDAQTFGEPGQRTFRLRILGSDSQAASLWMEKEQLQALSLALAQMLWQLRYQQATALSRIDEFPADAEYDLRVGRMAMGLDLSDRTIVLHAFDAGAGDEDEPTLSVRLTEDHCASLRQQLDEIIVGGRPLCALCHLPIDASGHACIRSNGHSSQPIPKEDAGDET